MKKYLLFSFLLLSVSMKTNAQNNLVRNGSFEQMVSGCGPSYLVSYWSEINSADIACGSTGYQNNQAPKDSFNYYGMISFDGELANPLTMFSREFVQQQLAQSLQLGKKYCCKFFINLIGSPVFPGVTHSNYGAYFSTTAITPIVMMGPIWIDYFPQVKNPIGVYPDTTNWLEVSGTFTANGTEQYITIGNFDSIDVMDYVVLNPNPNSFGTYMLLDDVHLVEVMPINLQSSFTLCSGDSVQLAVADIDAAQYNWSPAAGLSCTTCYNPKASPTSTTQYTLVVRQCEVIDTLKTTITVLPNTAIAAQAIDDVVVCSGSNIVIGNNPKDSATYTWLPTQGLSQSNIGNPTANIQSNISYTVTKVYCGVTSIDSVSLMVKECEPEIIIPNVFTPNGDNINELFQIKTNEYKWLKTVIYDRWGVKVFEADTLQPRWDGRTTSGKPCEAGTYYYVIEGENNLKEKINKNGFLQLIR